MSHPDSTANGKVLKRANPTTIQDKFLVGYQGWFTCGGDGEPVGPGHHGWLHWFNAPVPHGGHPNTDLWPDVSSYSPSELFPAPGLSMRSGEQAYLFSSRHPRTVQRHFRWMAEHGVDGAFLQRFVGECDLEARSEGIRKIRDEVGDRVREAAEKEGRVFALMYDVSGVAPDRIQGVIERDWSHLMHSKGILDSPNYLKEKGKPVVAVWGFGFDGRGHTPALVRAIVNYLRSATPGGAYIMAGAPAHWRTAESDADRNPEFLDVWLSEFDAISPWTVGRYTDEQSADHFAETKMKGDMELISRRNAEGSHRRIDYIPVVLPGGSGFNLSQGKWGFNAIKRKGGRFLWRQIFNAKHLGVQSIYGAMWDEYDEGTAFMPVVEKKSMLPVSDKFPFLALDEDGFDVPSDWYMRICGFAAEGLRGERWIHEMFPIKELQDYWSSRPKYEDEQKANELELEGGGHSGRNDQSYQSYEEWLVIQKDAKEEAPPPPYSLEAEEISATQSRVDNSPAAATSFPARQPSWRVASEATSSHRSELHAETSHNHPPVAQVSLSSQPPPINLSSRPQQIRTSYSVVSPQSPQAPPLSAQGAVSSLANKFGKMGVAAQSSPSPQPPGSAPPLHPAHLAHEKWPTPSSCSGPIHVSPSQGSQGPQQPTTTSIPNPWSPDTPSQEQAPLVRHSTYPGQTAGAKLDRPHSVNASSHPTTSSQPHGIVNAQQQTSSTHGPAPYRPPSNQSYGSSSSSSSSHVLGGVNQSPTAGVSSYKPGTPSAPLFPFGTNQYPNPSAYPEESGSSSFPLQVPYAQPGQASPIGSAQEGQPHTPHSASSSPSFLGCAYPVGHLPAQGFPTAIGGTTHPGQYSGHTYPSYGQAGYSPSSNYSQGGFFSFPQAQVPPALPAQGYPAFLSYYDQSSSSGPYGAAYSPTWYPGSSSPSAPPPIPPRPSNMAAPYGSPPPPAFPVTSQPSPTHSGPLGLALNAVDKLAGKKARQQLESGVESLAQSSSKFFNKLTK